MADMTLGPLSYEQRETAPPWGVSWLASPTPTVDRQETSDTFSVSRGATNGDQGHADQQKKKLFVGMAPKSAYEEDYRTVFAPFGTPIDIYVIRDRNGFSKGCAFVRYESVDSANDAIEALHDKYIMPGGFRTLVVTIADDRRGPQSPAVGRDAASFSGESFHALSRLPSFVGSNSGGGSGASVRGPAAPTGTRSVVAPHVACTSPASPLSSPLVSRLPYFFCGGNPPQGTYVYYPYVSQSSSQHAVSPLEAGAKAHHAFTVGSSAGLGTTSRCDQRVGGCVEPIGALGPPHIGARGVHETGSSGDGTVRNFGAIGPEEKGRRWAKQSVGPSGANLFVYYLPGSVTDADLATAFAPFGDVLSAKVYYDRDTGESKGFGFVSYATPDQADAAIARMDGFFIGQKRLKVVRKRGQQVDRCSDNKNNNSPADDVSYGAGADSAGDIGRFDSGDSGIERASSGGGGSGSGGGGCGCDGTVNGSSFGYGDHRKILSGSQLELDFLTPEGLLGQSMTRFL